MSDREQYIIDKCYEFGVFMLEHIAYILATVSHETNGTFKPVEEAYWLSDIWRSKHLYYYPYYGRGYVQITHKKNYNKFSKILHYQYYITVDLVKNPDRAMEKDIAIIILIHGMTSGSFTGKELLDYINDDIIDFINARRIINGKDKAKSIAEKAEEYLRKLKEL